jgi:four helix bundle protein
MQSFTDLEVWQTGLLLIKEIYRLTKKFPKEEQYAMTSQLRRSSTSILANIAEGFGRFTYADKAHKYTIARGECTEVEAFLYISSSVDFVTIADCAYAVDLTRQVGRMTSGLIRSCKNPRSSLPSPQ